MKNILNEKEVKVTRTVSTHPCTGKQHIKDVIEIGNKTYLVSSTETEDVGRETMVFDYDIGSSAPIYFEHYKSDKQMIQGHDRAVDYLKAGVLPSKSNDDWMRETGQSIVDVFNTVTKLEAKLKESGVEVSEDMEVDRKSINRSKN